MIARQTSAHLNDPQFETAMRQLQQGQWQGGLQSLERLIAEYPADQELRSLRKEMQLRARVDHDEAQDRARARRQKITRWGARLAVLTVLLIAAVVGISRYSSWIDQQLAQSNQGIQSQVQVLNLAFKYNSAQELLKSGKLEQAQALIDEIVAEQPNYNGLEQLQDTLNQTSDLQGRYQQALNLKNRDQLAEALSAFQAIAVDQPYYKDVAIQIQEIERLQLLAGQLAQAQMAYDSEEWMQAVTTFETLRAIDADYEKELVEERLYQSYLNAAEEVLADPQADLEALETAEAFFRKALTLRPQAQEVQRKRFEARQTLEERLVNSYLDSAQAALTDNPDSLQALQIAESYFIKALELRRNNPQVLLQRQLAAKFIKAQKDFLSQLWETVIADLEYVIAEDPTYANGTARQTLYEAYMARANKIFIGGGYEASLDDFKRAAELAAQDPEAVIPLLEAQLKIAEVQGALGEYEEAVTIYKALFEIGGLTELAGEDRTLASKLEQAQRSAELKYYRTAYRQFREVSIEIVKRYQFVSVTVTTGDYLTQLANRYNTTVGAILLANQDINPKDIAAGTVINIPVLEVENEE